MTPHPIPCWPRQSEFGAGHALKGRPCPRCTHSDMLHASGGGCAGCEAVAIARGQAGPYSTVGDQMPFPSPQRDREDHVRDALSDLVGAARAASWSAHGSDWTVLRDDLRKAIENYERALRQASAQPHLRGRNDEEGPY